MSLLRRWGFFFFVLALFLWATVPSLGDFTTSFVRNFHSYLMGVTASLKRILMGYSVSLVFGMALGVVFARFKILGETVGNLIGLLQVLPSICWLPLAILWFGLSEWAIQFVVIIGAFLPLVIATEGAIKNIPPLYIRAARTMGIKGFDLYWRVILPATLPSVMNGLKLSWVFAWRSLMAAELLFVTAGLGRLLQGGRERHDIPQVVTVMLLILFIGLVVDNGIFGPVQRHLQKRWGTA